MLNCAWLLGTIHILRKHLNSTKLNLITKSFIKTGFFRQNKRVYFSTLHFDEIFILQWIFLVSTFKEEKFAQKNRENVVVDNKKCLRNI